MSLADMSQVLAQLTIKSNKNVLVGLNTLDDAGVYKLTADTALILTIDVFSPIVDSPYDFGKVVAANCLSDVYAMGGKPLYAMNIVSLPESVLAEHEFPKMIRGAEDKVKEAGAVLYGREILFDKEIKYGMAVAGLVNPKKIIANSGAKPKDKLILTKPISSGVISVAASKGEVPSKLLNEVTKSMTTLNKIASETMLEIGVNACTDITGFGLLGHAHQMAEMSGVSLIIYSDEVPKFSDVEKYAKEELMSIGTLENKKYLISKIKFNSKISEELVNIFFDAQTSGGLLIAVSENLADKLLKKLKSKGIKEAKIIGEVVAKRKEKIEVI